TMEYLGSLDNPDDLFRAEVMLAGLGAIMDVTVTVSAALGEIVHKNPQVTFLQLFRSGREIGYDIMGTMMNVLLFVFGCGLIPTFLIRMNNEVRLLTIVRLNIPYEICRFLIESIGIVLAIPITILIASLLTKFRFRTGGEKC
ncbi:MAG TPA: YibE/F family protein, partial [Lachnospiraceae bacterium]|nr:YibE/F family protein [Lachnospiraceae bacterium]